MSTMKARLIKILRWSEKYTKTDMVYLIKNGLWSGSAQFVSAVLGLLASIAFANLLPQEIYGQYKYLFSIAGIIWAFSLTNLSISVTQAVSRGFEGT